MRKWDNQTRDWAPPKERKQKWRKDSVIVSFLSPVDLLAQVDEAVSTQQKRTRATPLNRSSWILRAIKRDLDHRNRSRSKHGKVSRLAKSLAGEGQSVQPMAAGPESAGHPLDQRVQAAVEAAGGGSADLGVSLDIRQPTSSMGVDEGWPAVGNPNADTAPNLGQGMVGPPQFPSSGDGEVRPVLPSSAELSAATLVPAEGR
jgi:hypothetical protein